MTDPYSILGISAEADDETIRKRYLELVRRFPPEHHPEKFAGIRQAYESLRDRTTRLRYRLFEAGKKDSLDGLIEEISCQSSRRRVPLKTMLSMLK